MVLVRTEELVKGWLLAMVEDAPLEEAATILTGDVARDGPRICDVVVRAICEEADLRRIEPGGVLEPLVSRAGELAGARTAEAAAHAVETLKDVIWSALRAELSQDDPDLLGDVAERLALVVESVRSAVLRRAGAVQAVSSRPAQVAPLRVARPEPSSDRREGVGSAGSPEEPETPGQDAPGVLAEPRDAPWVAALRDEIAHASRARSPLSLLLVELEEAERLVAAEARGEASVMFGRFAQAVRAAVRRRDVLACETDSRAWIIARDTDRAGAQALGSRIATAVPAEESWRGAPLAVSVGVAVLGEDGHDAARLIEVAEQTRFAAEASGIGILTAAAGNGEADPAGPGLVG